MKLEQQEEAKKLYFQTSKTQKEIADAVGVSDRTIRTWIKDEAWHIMKQRALEMPAMIADNFCTQIINLQNKIQAREDGIPTLEETQTMHKLTLCIMKLKDYPSSGSMIQFMQNFLDMSKGDPDTTFLREATHRANHMILQKNKQGFTPFHFEYGAQPSYIQNIKASAPAFDEGCPQGHERSSEGGGDYQPETKSANIPSSEGQGVCHQTETKSTETNNITPPWGSRRGAFFPTPPEIPTSRSSQPVENNKTTQTLTLQVPEQKAEETGNLPGRSHLNGRQPSIMINSKICLEWKGEGIIHDYSINKQRKITPAEWNAFITHGYTPHDLDNYQWQ